MSTASNRGIERAGWIAKHPLTDAPVEVVTLEWFREVRLERDALLNAAQYALLNNSVQELQAVIDSCRPRKSNAEIRNAIEIAIGGLE